MIYTYNPSQDEKLGWAKTEEIQELLTSQGVRTDSRMVDNNVAPCPDRL